jgi:hypothetical protein
MSNLVNNINELSPNVHSPQPSDTALGNTTDQRSTLAHLQSCNSPSSDSDVEDASFLRRPPHPLGTAQSVSTSLTTEQFQHVLLNITESIRSTTTQSAPTEDNPFAVARAEFYISQGLTFKFDGTHEKLAPWIKKFKALRSNALWHDATYIMHEATTYDILSDFMKIKENVIKPFAKQRTSPGNQASSLKPEHQDLFYARILGKVVISSITDEFYTTLQNYAGDEMAGDGPLLLWLILTHFHTSTITYQEQLKQQIRTRSLATDHNEDVEAYLLWLRHHLYVLATTSGAGSTNHNDLMDPIFQQLLTTKSTHLRRLVEDKHLAYHSEEQAFTPASLVESLEKLCRALRQSNQLYTTVDTDIMALLGAHKTAHIVTPPPTNKPQSGAGHHTGHTHSGTGHNAGNTHRSNTCSGRPQWYDKPPKDLNQTHLKTGYGIGAPAVAHLVNGYVPTLPPLIQTILLQSAKGINPSAIVAQARLHLLPPMLRLPLTVLKSPRSSRLSYNHSFRHILPQVLPRHSYHLHQRYPHLRMTHAWGPRSGNTTSHS